MKFQIGSARFLVNGSVTMFALSPGGKIHICETPSAFISRLASLAWAPIRNLFPFFMVRGLRCCDHGGQVMRTYRVFAWNGWHLDQLQCHDHGDGPDMWWNAGFREWIKHGHGSSGRSA